MSNFKDHITLNLIQPNYINEITTFINGRSRWRSVGMAFETTSKILMGAGSVLSFAAGVYSNVNFSFIAGSVSTLSVVSLQFATFCYRESKQSSDDLNIILKKLKLDTLPDIIQQINDPEQPHELSSINIKN